MSEQGAWLKNKENMIKLLRKVGEEEKKFFRFEELAKIYGKVFDKINEKNYKQNIESEKGDLSNRINIILQSKLELDRYVCKLQR